MDAWQARLAFVGEQVLVTGAEGVPVEGKLLGVDAEGSLLLEDGTGKTMVVQVGDVQIRPNF
jgi:biotin-(acetyl-CoA carboxylase) ligase